MCMWADLGAYLHVCYVSRFYLEKEIEGIV